MNKRIMMISCLVLLALMHHAAAIEKSSKKQRRDIGITILYDNYVFTEGLKSDWGFSCLLTGTEKTVLFDTGTKGELLLENIEKMKVDPKVVDIVVVSHNHRDHTGGLLAFLGKNSDVSVCLPPSCSEPFIRKVKETGARVVTKDGPAEICKGVHLTGPMGAQIVEQSMIVEAAAGTFVVTGCAHPGIVQILRKSKEVLPGDIHLVFGGFHLSRKSEAEIQRIINEFRELGVRKVGPTHCTGNRAIQAFKQAYGSDFIQMGVGRTLRIEASLK